MLLIIGKMKELEKNLWKRCDTYLPFLSWIPFLRMVAVCNNLAFSKVDDESDIDLFIVAKKGRLFIVRTLVTIALHLAGVRRHGNKIAGRFCLSFFVDDSALDFRDLAIDRDIYLAFWIFTMRPIIDDGIYDEIIAANSWIWDFVNADAIFSKELGRVDANSLDLMFASVLGGVLSGGFGDFVESLLMKWQIKRASKKATKLGVDSSVIVSPHVLKFHNRDRRRVCRERWESDLKSRRPLDLEEFVKISP